MYVVSAHTQHFSDVVFVPLASSRHARTRTCVEGSTYAVSLQTPRLIHDGVVRCGRWLQEGRVLPPARQGWNGDVKSKRCSHQGCTTKPSFGVDDGSKKAEYCSQHAKAGMVNVKKKSRSHQGCTTKPSFGVDDGSKKAEYCSQHAKAGMVNVKKKRCSHQGCTTKPSFGVDDGSKKAEYCSQHAKAGMVNVKKKRCAHRDCTKQPCFGMDDGRKKAEYCSQHVKAGMVNVISKKCAQQGCTTTPSYGMDDGRKKAEYRVKHATAGMVNVKIKRCAHHGCAKSCNVRFCLQHATEGRDHAQAGRGSSNASEARAGRTRGGTVDGLSACRPGAAAKREKTVLEAASSTDADGASSKKRARQISASPAVPAVLVKAEEAGRLDEGGVSCSLSGRPRQTGRIQLRLTPPIRRRTGNTAVKTEAAATT